MKYWRSHNSSVCSLYMFFTALPSCCPLQSRPIRTSPHRPPNQHALPKNTTEPVLFFGGIDAASFCPSLRSFVTEPVSCYRSRTPIPCVGAIDSMREKDCDTSVLASAFTAPLSCKIFHVAMHRLGGRIPRWHSPRHSRDRPSRRNVDARCLDRSVEGRHVDDLWSYDGLFAQVRQL